MTVKDSSEKKSFFSRLKERLSETSQNLVGRIQNIIKFSKKIDENLFTELEEALICADVGVVTTEKIIKDIRKKVEERKITDSEKIMDLLKEIIKEIFGNDINTLALGMDKPQVVLFVGVNGVGKTTTMGKIAHRFIQEGKLVMLVAGDTFRAAAIEQLEIWANRCGGEFYKQKMNSDPASVCYDAIQTAKNKGIDVVLIDTAGRLHTKVNLMEELKKMVRVIQKLIPEAPHETILILDANTGQNAISQVKMFREAVKITSMIMTKIDGTAKGGVILGIKNEFDLPIIMIGIGEDLEDLKDFDSEMFVNALFSQTTVNL